MPRPFLALVAALASALAPAAHAGGSGAHSTTAVILSGAASSEGSAAASAGAGALVSVPLISGGAALSITGAGLQSSGAASVEAGSDTLAPRRLPLPAPDGAPRLD